MKIAISTEVPGLQNNGILKRNVTKKYNNGAGCEWAFFLNEKIKHIHTVVSADIALRNVKNKIWNAFEILVIQHMDDKNGRELIDLGSIPFIILTLESPLYQGNFFDKSVNFINKFQHKLIYDGLMFDSQVYKENFSQIRYPSYSLDDIPKKNNSKIINKAVFVNTNQYIHHKKISEVRSIDDFKWLLRRVISQLRFGVNHSKVVNSSKYQLHDKRLELICEFLDNNLLDIYGKGWDNYDGLPKVWKNKLLHKLGKPIDRFFKKNKLDCIKNYRFCLCVENFEYSGYITEKIIQSLVAQSLPIYFGAPNIKDYIPSDCFIHAREFESSDLLIKFINNMDKNQYDKMILSGQNYLKNPLGMLHSNEIFAENIEILIQKEMKMQ